ncbi:hypothetical protein [Microbispora sp. GKU 823]|uniref:hypothetical protein n=1 Tax=Microbispora sp. GKU 823 TaxID=1652100 RepID=UPI0009A2D70C|nr:hypothetical protein [Microbispora sp. GKU 823]OPG12992.1 hypothetical protein B1L11_11340 [Microbispora sp. GKU 823]
MRWTATLLSATLLGSLLTAPPVLAAPAPMTAPTSTSAAARPASVVKTAVARVKASPATRTGACPTTVGFSAVVAAKGKGTVRYRWVRGDGSKGAIRSFRVNGARKVVVRDRQTFDRSTSGWQAVEILGKKGLSAKGRFDVRCTGAVVIWDTAHPLPAGPGAPLVAAAAVSASPATYRGACPTTVTFTGTIQVSRTPAKVYYRWIDSGTGEGRLESLFFAAGGPRSRQVTLPLAVGSSTAGWKAIRIVNAGGRDSGRAAYTVTCTTTPPTSPSPSAPPSRSPSPSPSSSPSTSPSPSASPTPPPVQTPVPRITDLTPGDYEGSCLEPVAYQATGQISLPAGAAQRVEYWWSLDGSAWQQQFADFPAGDQPRVQNVSATWSLDSTRSGSHTIALQAEGGPAQPAQRTFTFTCVAEGGDATLTVEYMLTPHFKGECDGSFPMRASAMVLTDRDAEVTYRLVVDGKPGVLRTAQLKPGVRSTIGDFWYGNARSSGSGVVRLEILNQNKPVKQAPYSWTCVAPDPSPGTVQITEIESVGYYGDCVVAPYVTAFGEFKAPAGTEITYRWVVDGVAQQTFTHTVPEGGVIGIQAWYWTRAEKTDGTVKIEVLNHNKPTAQAAYPVNCQG